MGEQKRIVLIIPVYNPDNRFVDCLRKIKEQDRVEIETLIIDSGTKHDYRKYCNQENIKIVNIVSEKFNHGGTRQWGIDLFPYDDIFVFLTQDAILYDSFSVAQLVEAFKDDSVGAVYGRQIPHDNAKLFARIAREFNYKNKSYIYSYKDREIYGIKTCFMSNSFAAYRKKAMEQVGGFPKNTILSEDMYVAAKMLIHGWKIGYVAEACVYHSHDYSILQEFNRYFDIGVFHSRESWIRSEFGLAEGEGRKFVWYEIRQLLKEEPSALIEMAFRDFAKLIGYRLGLNEKYMPMILKEKISMNKKFFMK